MEKRVKIALVAVLLALVSIIGWQVLRPHQSEPAYRGKPLSYWLNDYGDGNFVGIGAQMAKKEADEAVRHIGTNAIPFLLRRLQREDSRLRIWLMEFSQKHRLKLPLTPTAVRCNQALQGVKALSLEDAKVCSSQIVELIQSRRAYSDKTQWSNFYLTAALRHISTEVQNEHMQWQIQKAKQERTAQN